MLVTVCVYRHSLINSVQSVYNIISNLNPLVYSTVRSMEQRCWKILLNFISLPVLLAWIMVWISLHTTLNAGGSIEIDNRIIKKFLRLSSHSIQTFVEGTRPVSTFSLSISRRGSFRRQSKIATPICNFLLLWLSEHLYPCYQSLKSKKFLAVRKHLSKFEGGFHRGFIL